MKPLVKYHKSLATVPTALVTHYPSISQTSWSCDPSTRVFTLCLGGSLPARDRLLPPVIVEAMDGRLSKLQVGAPQPLNPAEHHSGPSRTYTEEGCLPPEVTTPVDTQGHREETPRLGWTHGRGAGTSLGPLSLLFSFLVLAVARE